METQLFFYLTLSFILTPILYYFLLYDPKLREPTTGSPPSYAVIGCLISFYQNRHRLLSWYTDLLSSSPTQTIVIHRLGARKTIVTANPQNVEYILKTNFLNFPKGKPFTEILNDFLGRGIFNVDGDLWHAQRKLASHQFTSRSLKEHVEITVKETVKTKLLPLLDSLVDVEGVDLQEVLRRFGFDVVCKLSLGFDPCCLGDQDSLYKVVPILTAFDMAAEISAKRAATPVAATWKFKKLFGVGSEQVLKNCVKTIHEYIESIVHERKNSVSSFYENKDLLSRMIVGGLSEDMIRDMMISFIMAGKDTTSAAMTWLFYAISQHANVEKHLVNEIISNFNDEQCDSLQEMKYLHACICETMRLYPPVAWDSKHAADADVLPDGTKVMAGDRVTYFPYGMGRMESVWGENRLDFNPNRWFDNEPAESEPGENLGLLKEVSPYKYPVFQAGPRVCLGKGKVVKIGI